MLTFKQRLTLIGLIDSGKAPQDAEVRQALLDSGAVELVGGIELRPTAKAQELLQGEPSGETLAKYVKLFVRIADSNFRRNGGSREGAAVKVRVLLRAKAARQGVDIDEMSDNWVKDRLLQDVRKYFALFLGSGMSEAEALDTTRYLLKGRGEWRGEIFAAISSFQDEKEV